MALAPGLKKRGLFGASAQMPQESAMTTTARPLAPAKPSFFGEGGVGRAIAGNIGDFLLQYSGMNPIYAPAMQQRQQMAYDQQRRQLDRVRGLQDWVAKQEWEREHPAPVNNDTVADYNFWKGVLSPEDFEKWRQNKIDPPQYRQGPDGNFYRINPTAPPTFTDDDWNSGAPVNGGPTPSASGGFR